MVSSVSLISIMQNFATMVTGPFGISAIIVGIAASFVAAALHFLPPRSGFIAMGCGAGAFTAGWLVQTYLSSGV